MRRSRKHKLLLTSTYILIYSIIHVLSKEALGVDVGGEETPTSTSWGMFTSTVGVPMSKSSDHHSSTTESTTAREETENSTEESLGGSTTTESYKVPTLRPRRTNCTPPAIEQFPRPLMGPYARRHGGLVIHFLVAIYTFIGLAIVCDEYFVSSLDRICEELKLSPDVAGATFMAAGSSAPELATVVIGVFFAKDDIGVSGVIGSAVFNIMFVISVCALSAGTVCYLNWWPLCRDCFFYAISILVMLCTIFDEVITWGESLFMLLLYIIYCIALHFNPQLEAWAQTWPVPCKKLPEEQSHLVAYKTLDEDRAKMATYTNETAVNMPYGKPEQNNTQPVQNNVESYEVDIFNQWSPTHTNAPQSFDAPQPMQPQVAPPMQQMSPPQQQQQQQQQPQVAAQPQGAPGQPLQPVQQQYYKPKDTSNIEKVDHLLKPESGYYALFSWGVVFPIHYMCIKTIPDCKSEKYKNWYPFTFLLSMIWISFYSYIMVWMITIIGSTLGVPDTLMGLTFVAAGVSVPDALSSIAVIKEGYGDMAVSNAVGSNVFDILICLGLPWFIQTAIISPGSHVNVISKGLTYSTLSLLSTVIFLVVATHLNGWKLDKRYGVILMVWYVIFIVFAGMYELNIFGQLNPPECPSAY